MSRDTLRGGQRLHCPGLQFLGGGTARWHLPGAVILKVNFQDIFCKRPFFLHCIFKIVDTGNPSQMFNQLYFCSINGIKVHIFFISLQSITDLHMCNTIVVFQGETPIFDTYQIQVD